MNSFNTFAPPQDNSRHPLLPQTNHNEPKSWNRWLILLLSCISTIGVYFTDAIMGFETNTFIDIFPSYTETRGTILGYACIVPLIAGLMIYRFGVKGTYLFFALLLTIGRSLTFSGFRNQAWTVFAFGESFFYAANYGLWVAQMFTIIRWFKGKELSFAIGFVGFSNFIGNAVAVFLEDYVNSIGLSNLLLFGLVLCIAATIAVIILIRIDQEEDESQQVEKSFIEDLGSIKKKSIMVISLAIICFSLANFSSKSWYIQDMNRKFRNLNFLNWFNQLIPLLMLPLFGLLADWKKKRIGAMFIAIVMFFIGNTVFCLFHQSTTYLIFIYIAFLLFRFGYTLFQVSSFACLGIVTPTRVLGLILGLIYSLTNFANWTTMYIYSKRNYWDVSLICYMVTFALVFGVGLVVYIWKLNREEGGGKIESRVLENDIENDDDQMRMNYE